MAKQAVAILGGTGDQGLGLAYRFTAAGRPVRIGSRRLERAEHAAQQVRKRVEQAEVEGFENLEAARRSAGEIVILSVPFEHSVPTLKGVTEALTPGTVLISMAAPLATAVGGSATHVLQVSQGSCAELCQQLAPEGVSVVSAFQNVSAHRLLDLEHPVECDVIVSGAKQPRGRVIELCQDIPGLRGIDGGPLFNARYVEQLTAMLIGVNVRYKIPHGVGIRLTYI